MKYNLKKIQNFLNKYERILLPATMIFGFIVDSLTLNRADQVLDNVILLTHLFIVATSILLIFISREKIENNKFILKIKPFLPYFMQYSLGNLFSGLIVLYSRSGTFLTSFPFFIILLTLLISNEFVHRKYPWLTLQISLFFVALTSYTTLITPILFREISTTIFIIGTIFAVGIISLYIILLEKLLPQAFRKHEKNILVSIGGIFILFNFLYFTNLIPPIPLSLKDGGVFHNVIRNQNGDYEVLAEKPKWYRPYRNYALTYNHKPSEPIYVFSSVFAPTKITETIYHKWYFFDEKESRWILSNSIPITIIGGREAGFRGYSEKSVLSSGKWRIDITNTKGQIIGRLKVNVINSNKKPNLEKRIY